MEHREEPSGGFDFLDLIFGADPEADDPLDDSSSEVSEVISSTSSTPVKATTEKSFLDILRAGLELIDANSDKIGAAIGVNNITKKVEKPSGTNKSEVSEPSNSNIVATTALPSQPAIPSQSPIKILNSITAKVESPEPTPTTTMKATETTTTVPQTSTTTTVKPTTKKVLTDSPIKYVYLTTRSSQKPKNSSSKYVASNLIRSTTPPPVVKLLTSTKPTTTQEPSTTTETPSTTTEKVKPKKKTTLKTTTTKIPMPKPSRINDKVLDNMDDVIISTEPTTTLPPPPSTKISKVAITTTAKPSPTTQKVNKIPEELKNSTKVAVARPTGTTENILTAFFSGLSSIFENPENLKKKPIPSNALREKIQSQQSIETSFTPKPPVPRLPPVRNPLPNPAVSAHDKPMPIPVEDYTYSDYSDATLPPSLPNLKIIPFLPTDAVDKVNYYKPNPIPLSENLEIYGSPGSTKESESYAGLDYGANYNPYDKEHYLAYSTIQDSAKDKTEVSELSITENYEGKTTAFPKFDKSKLNSPNHVRYNNKFIQDKYETLDYDFNPHEKVDNFDTDIKYIPSKYESAVYSTDYNKYGSNGVVYPADISQSEKYYYGDGYESVYNDNSGGQFSPPTKTEGHFTKFNFSFHQTNLNFYSSLGGFVPKDAVKNEFFFGGLTTKLGSVTESAGNLGNSIFI